MRPWRADAVTRTIAAPVAPGLARAGPTAKVNLCDKLDTSHPSSKHAPRASSSPTTFGSSRNRLVVLLMTILALVACSGDTEPSTTPAPAAPSTPSPTVPATTTTTLAPAARAAAELAAAEAAIHDPATPDDAMDQWGQVQQAAIRELVFHPELEADALALLPADVRAAADAHLAAAKDLTALNGPVEVDRPLPHWRIVPPEPAAVLLAHYRDAEAATGVPWEYLAAVHLVETRMGRIRGDSSAGARGPMQFIPSTWEIYGQGGDIESTRDSIHAAARLLRASGARTDMAAALFSYNNSNRYVRAVTVYARQMEADERTYLAYHGWQVYYGERLLPEGTIIP